MAHDHILHTGIHQHVRRDLSGIRALVLEIQVLSAHLDVGSLYRIHHRYDIDGRYAEYHIHIRILTEGLQCLAKRHSL